MTRRDPVAQVWSVALEVVRQMEEWLRTDVGHDLCLRYKPVDQVRLCRLRTWELRYRMAVRDIIDLLVPVMRRAIARGRKKKYKGLGVSIAALTSDGAEDLLQELIEERYPAGEHIAEWRECERQKQLDAEEDEETGGFVLRERRVRGIVEYDSIADYAAAYIARVEAEGKQYEKQVRKHRKMHYRWSPWR